MRSPSGSSCSCCVSMIALTYSVKVLGFCAQALVGFATRAMTATAASHIAEVVDLCIVCFIIILSFIGFCLGRFISGVGGWGGAEHDTIRSSAAKVIIFFLIKGVNGKNLLFSCGFSLSLSIFPAVRTWENKKWRHSHQGDYLHFSNIFGVLCHRITSCHPYPAVLRASSAPSRAYRR